MTQLPPSSAGMTWRLRIGTVLDLRVPSFCACNGDGSDTTVSAHWWTRAWAKVTAFGRGGTVETKHEGDTSVTTHDLARALGFDAVADRMRTPDRR